MSERGLPPYPLGGDWQTWARQLVEYLNNQARSEEFVAPRVVSLLHQIPPVDQYRALEDGLLMYDPSLGVPVYSKNGQWNQFTAQGELNFVATDDAGNGTVVNDINNTDFTGQEGANGMCAEVPVATVTAFFHKGVQYLYAGPTPASYGLGCSDTMQDSYLIPVGVGTFLALTDTPDSYTNQANKWPRVSPTEGELVFDEIQELDIINLDRTRWRGNWVQQTYAKNDMVADKGYLMVANKQTDDTAAPLPVGDALYLYEGTDTTAVKVASQVIHGAQYENTEAFFVDGYRVYTVAENKYEIILVNNVGTPDQEVTFINSFTANNTGWREFSVERVLVPIGTKFQALSIVSQPDPSPVITIANYDYQKPQNATAPLSGQAVHANKELTYISFHKTDNDGTDRSALLVSLKAGDTIVGGVTRQFTWGVQSVTDQGTYVDVFVAPAAQNNESGVTPFEFSVVTPQPVTILEDVDWWLTSSPAGGTIKGVYVEDDDYTNVVINDTAYGVDLRIQSAYISPDWDVMAAPSTGGGGGGGGGASTFTELADTPASYAGEGDKFVKVTATEDGLEFGTVSGDFVLTTGDTMTGDLFITKVNPALWLVDENGPTNNKITRIMQDDNRLRFSRMDDLGISATTLALLDETGWTIRNPSGTWPIMQANGNIKGVGALFETGLFLRSDSNSSVSFRNAAEEEQYKITRDVVGNTLDVYKSDSGVNDRLIGRFEDVGTTITDDQALVTKQKGDARYNRWAGTWAAGGYDPFQVVINDDATWLCLVATTDEPSDASTDWVKLGVTAAPPAAYNAALLSMAADQTGRTGAANTSQRVNFDTVTEYGTSFIDNTTVGQPIITQAGLYKFSYQHVQSSDVIDGVRIRAQVFIEDEGLQSTIGQTVSWQYIRNISGAGASTNFGNSSCTGLLQVAANTQFSLRAILTRENGTTHTMTTRAFGTQLLLERISD